MKCILSVLFTLISFAVTATNHYVAPNGNDSNPGTITQPWATWGKAFTSRSPGDTVYFRGGIYYSTVTNGLGYSATAEGAVNDTICFLNYPGETPILDCSTVNSTTYNHNYGLTISGSYFKIKGLTVRNVWQLSPTDEADAWIIGGNNIKVENCTAYNTHGVGFEIGGREVYVVNCDSYNNCDSLTTELPGNDGYGFNIYNDSDVSQTVYYKNCRAWNCGDDGWAGVSAGYIEYDGCWSFNNGMLQGGGSGFKLGWATGVSSSVRRFMKNCIAAYNRASGVTANDNGTPAQEMHLYNNTAYHNGYRPFYGGSGGYGFMFYNTTSSDAQELKRIVRNNISYDNDGPYQNDGDYWLGSGALFTHSYNSWNLDITVTDADFKALPSSESDGIALLSSARQADGSLPDLGDYFQLVSGSDARGAGMNLGLTYDAAGHTWANPPSIGAFEYYDEDQEPSDATDILAFTLADQTAAATINTTSHTVAIEVDYTANVASLTPTITLSEGATVIPASGVSRDFTNPVPYTVTALDGTTTQEWVVTVTQEEDPEEPPVYPEDSLIIRYNGKIIRL